MSSQLTRFSVKIIFGEFKLGMEHSVTNLFSRSLSFNMKVNFKLTLTFVYH